MKFHYPSDFKRRKEQRKKEKRTTILLLIIIAILYSFIFYQLINLEPYPDYSIKKAQAKEEIGRFPTAKDKSMKEKVIGEIRKQANSSGIDPDFAVKMANCESTFDPFAENPRSSAKGVYQFIDSTWQNYCSGQVKDYRDNIKCFMNNWHDHPGWWKQSWDCAGY